MDVLTQVEIVVSMMATTDKMKIEELTTTILASAPLAAKDQQLPLPVPSASVFMIHGVAYAGPFAYKI